MMKSEWPQIVPMDECRTVSAAVMDVGEYLGIKPAHPIVALRDAYGLR